MPINKLGRAASWLTVAVMAAGTTMAAVSGLLLAQEYTWLPIAQRLLIALAVIVTAGSPWWALVATLVLRHRRPAPRSLPISD